MSSVVQETFQVIAVTYSAVEIAKVIYQLTFNGTANSILNTSKGNV